MSSRRLINEQTIFRFSLFLTVAGGALLSFWRGSVGLGLLLGGMMGSLGFRILTLDISRMLKYPSKDVARRAMRGYLKRYGLYGATISVSLLNEGVSFFAAVLGLLIPKLVVLVLVLARGGRHAT